MVHLVDTTMIFKNPPRISAMIIIIIISRATISNSFAFASLPIFSTAYLLIFNFFALSSIYYTRLLCVGKFLGNYLKVEIGLILLIFWEKISKVLMSQNWKKIETWRPPTPPPPPRKVPQLQNSEDDADGGGGVPRFVFFRGSRFGARFVAKSISAPIVLVLCIGWVW